MNEVMQEAFQAELEKIAFFAGAAKAVGGALRSAGQMFRGGGRGATRVKPPAPKKLVTETRWAKSRTGTIKGRSGGVSPSTLTRQSFGPRGGSGSSSWNVAPALTKKSSSDISSEDIMMSAFIDELDKMGHFEGMSKEAKAKLFGGIAEKITEGFGKLTGGFRKAKTTTAPKVDRVAVARRLARQPAPKVPTPRTRMASPRARETARYLKQTRATERTGTRFSHGRTKDPLPFFPKGRAGSLN